MTSPAPTQNVPANSNATSSTASYASAAGASGKATATPVIATGSSSPVVVGSSSAPTNSGTSNARPASVSPLNGSAGSSNKPNNTNANMSGNAAPSQGAPSANGSNSSSSTGKPITPAVPAVINGSSSADHARKSSVTISATGPSGFIANGGAGAGPKAPLPKFGYDESPAIAHSTPSQPIAGNNQRIPSPAQSPIPIPQPSASGGRPPSTISQDGSNMKFGSFGGDGDRHLKHGNFSNTPGGLPVGNASPHFRRGSTHSVHSQSDMAHGNHNNHGHHGGPGPNRGGFQPGGGRGGRGGYNGSTHYNNQAMPFQPGNGPYPRGPSGQGRGGMAPQFQPRGVMAPNFGPNSPQAAAARVSPAIPPAVPNNGTPQMQNAIPVPGGSPYMQMQYANTTGFPPHSNVNTAPFPYQSKSNHNQQDGGDQQGQSQPNMNHNMNPNPNPNPNSSYSTRGGVYRKKGARGGGGGGDRGGERSGGGDRGDRGGDRGGGDRYFSYQYRAFDSGSKCSDSQKQHNKQHLQSLQPQQSQQPHQPHYKKEHEQPQQPPFQQQQQHDFKKSKLRRNISKRWPETEQHQAKEGASMSSTSVSSNGTDQQQHHKHRYRFDAPSFVSSLYHSTSAAEDQSLQGPVPPQQQMDMPPPRRSFSTVFGGGNASNANTSFMKRPPVVDDLSPASGNYERLLTKKQNYQPYQHPNPHQQQMLHQQQHGPNGTPYMGYPGYAQVNPYQQQGNPAYNMPYAAHQQFNVPTGAPSMSRTSSQAASERPNSSTGQIQTPVSGHASLAVPGGTPGSAQKPAGGAAGAQFVKPKKNAIVIKNPQGETLDFNKMAPASPGPNAPAVSRTPPVVVSATPPPQPKPTPPVVSHARTDSASVTKSAEQLRNEFKEQVRKTAGTPTEADSKAKAAEPAKAEEKKAAAPVVVSSTPAIVSSTPAKEEEKKAEPAAPAAAPAVEEKAAEAPKAEAASAPAAETEDEEMERIIREMEEEEAKREAAAAAYEIEKKKADAEKKKKEEADRAANAAANDALLREQEAEMERLEEERERKRKANADSGKEKSISEQLAEKISGITLSERKVSASGATATSTDALTSKLGDLKITDRTPALSPSSETSGGKRAKPSALNLAPINTKSVEPPQPSAALQSLKTARFLRDPTAIMYPKGIQSPNPALNPAVNKKGNFKYDTGFLLQFKDVFVEKPSLDFDQQVKSLIGDGDNSSRSGTRTPAGTNSGRQNSRSNAASAFNPGTGAMGSFNSKPLPPGTTSEQRFAMSAGSMPRPVGSMSSFGRPGGFPGPSNMTRTPSSSIGGGMPNSPRQGSRSTRGNSRQAGHSTKADQNAAKNMPLTQGMELKPITISASGWKPASIANRSVGAAGASPAPGGSATTMDPDMVQRKVKAALNKMTPEKFDKISDQILTIAMQSKDEEDGRTLRQVIQLTFEKATDEAHWAPMYAKFCKAMLDRMSPEIRDVTIKDKKGEVISGGTLFRKYLLNRCQQEFERGWKVDLPKPKEGESKETAMMSDEYYEAAAAKRRGLGLVQFIGELYKLGMLTERIMHECVRKLVDYESMPDEAEIESLSKLLRTVGANLDATEKGRPMMDAYFVRIDNVINIPELPSRLKFMLMDVVDLRAKHWVSQDQNKGPQTLEEVRQAAEAAAAAKALEAAKATQRGGGGRGLPRSDSRQFSYNQPIPNQVGMDDLRRLKGSATRISSANVGTLGPTSMFTSRSNSGRRNGPGGAFGRSGDDSGPASRTGTPPTRQDSNPVSHSNAFSALANVDTETPASPPSTAASPALAKSSLDKASS